MLDADSWQAPRYRSLVATAVRRGPSDEPVYLSADLLADFKGVTRDNKPIKVSTFGANRPVAVTCGDHFVGLLMPVRVDDDPGTPLTEWAELLEAS